MFKATYKAEEAVRENIKNQRDIAKLEKRIRQFGVIQTHPKKTLFGDCPKDPGDQNSSSKKIKSGRGKPTRQQKIDSVLESQQSGDDLGSGKRRKYPTIDRKKFHHHMITSPSSIKK